jgi:hypothetical protein
MAKEDIDGGVLNRVRNLTVQSPPHEGLIDLVQRKDGRRRGKCDLMWLADVAKRIDADGADNDSRHQVGFGGETHALPDSLRAAIGDRPACVSRAAYCLRER